MRIAITGAFGYSGKYIARRLLDAGHEVITLTNSAHKADPFQGRVRAFPFCFDDPGRLVEALRGVDALINTYWVRFNHRNFTFAQAVQNTRVLFSAAKAAGVRRIVHVSITNPSEDSPFEYFRGKAALEKALRESGISYAILRPAVLFGREDILVNNIAWALRRFPVIGVFGDGLYRIRPIHVEDLAGLAADAAVKVENAVIQAVGPETFAYCDLVKETGRIIGRPRPVIGLPPYLGYLALKCTGWLQGDVMITYDEVRGLMAGLLDVDAAPAGPTRLTDWARQNAETLGVRYASELARRK